ncbi:MAG TPA: cytochrome c-type biogenesis protein CcmH [Burkholderiaceae bacterium]|nr:cytochrome c-type biogenesis protein CcmH [Burkholderiaceae bacterium]
MAFALPGRLWARAVFVWFGLFLAGLGLAIAGQDLQSDEQIEARVASLSAQVSCAVCEPAVADDPRSSLALEFRTELRRLVEKGQSDTEVVESLIARYGDFVRYRPAVDEGEPLVLAFMLFVSLLGAAALTRVFHRDRALTLAAGAQDPLP